MCSKRRRDELDEELESLARELGCESRAERAALHSKLLSVELMKEKLHATRALANAQTILAQIDVLGAECALRAHLPHPHPHSHSHSHPKRFKSDAAAAAESSDTSRGGHEHGRTDTRRPTDGDVASDSRRARDNVAALHSATSQQKHKIKHSSSTQIKSVSLHRVSTVTPLTISGINHVATVTPVTISGTNHVATMTPFTISGTNHVATVTPVTISGTNHVATMTPFTISGTNHVANMTPLTIDRGEHTLTESPLSPIPKAPGSRNVYPEPAFADVCACNTNTDVNVRVKSVHDPNETRRCIDDSEETVIIAELQSPDRHALSPAPDATTPPTPPTPPTTDVNGVLQNPVPAGLQYYLQIEPSPPEIVVQKTGEITEKPRVAVPRVIRLTPTTSPEHNPTKMPEPTRKVAEPTPKVVEPTLKVSQKLEKQKTRKKSHCESSKENEGRVDRKNDALHAREGSSEATHRDGTKKSTDRKAHKSKDKKEHKSKDKKEHKSKDKKAHKSADDLRQKLAEIMSHKLEKNCNTAVQESRGGERGAESGGVEESGAEPGGVEESGAEPSGASAARRRSATPSSIKYHH